MMRILEKHKTREQITCLGILAGIIFLALVLRIWGINFGLPFTYHVDEPTYVSAALNLGTGKVGRQLNPPPLSNLLFLNYGLYYVVNRISGDLASVAEFENLYRTNPTVFFLIGRSIMAFMGVLNVLVIYLIGKEAWNKQVGILAALFLSTSFLHVRDSHYAVPDVMMTFLASTCIFFCLLLLKKPNRKYLSLAFVLGGITIATKWSAWPILFPLFYIFFVYENLIPNRKINRHSIFDGGVAIFSILMGFFIPSFQIILQPKEFLSYALAEIHTGEAGGFGIWQIDVVPGYVFYLKTLWYGIGFILFAISIFGCIRHVRLAFSARGKTSILLLAFPILYYVFMGSSRHYFARYALPIIPFFVLFAAEWVSSLVTSIGNTRKKIRWAFIALFVLTCIFQPLVSSIRYDYLMTRTDTRTIAKIWIDENIPAGSKIAVDWPVHTPPLDKDYYEITMEKGTGLSNNTIEYYNQQGFDYLIASSYIYNIPLVFSDKDADRRAFYASLDSELEVVKRFSPSTHSDEVPFIFDEIYGPVISLWQREQPGPTLKIYRVLK